MKTIGEILTTKTSKLASILQRNQQSCFLNTIFHNIIDPVMATHCSIVKIENNELLVSIDNASWATKFRYIIPELLKNIKTQPEFNNITTIRYIIYSAKTTPAKQVKRKPPAKKHIQLLRSIIAKL